MLSLSTSTGFSILQSPLEDFSTEGAVVRADNPLEQTFRVGIGGKSDQRDREIEKLIGKAINAYLVDGIVRQSVDKYTELFLDFHLQGGDAQVAYIEKRLNAFSLSTGEYWKTLFSRLIHEYFKTGNAFIIKYRGAGPVRGKRPVYDLKPYSISGLFLISADRLSPMIDKNTGHFVGWGLHTKSEDFDYELVAKDAKPLPTNDVAIRLAGVPKSIATKVLVPGVDIVQVAYKKGADSAFGIGISFPALEDVSLLRTIEQYTAILIKKYSTPIIHHKVTQTASPLAGVQQEINRAASLYKNMSPEGVIVTSGAHEIKAIGSESQALRLDPYLKHFTNRAFSGLGTSPYLMGFEAATLGTAEAAEAMLLTRVRFCQQEIARELETFLINELLWEGGFDPYNEEDDIVKLKFEEVDQTRKIKIETHAADLYTKNLLPLGEARAMMGRSEEVDEAEMYLNRVQIPLEKAKGEVKKALAATNKPSNASVRKRLPSVKEDIDDFVILMERDYSIPRDTFYPYLERMKALVEDEEALFELVKVILGTNDEDN